MTVPYHRVDNLRNAGVNLTAWSLRRVLRGTLSLLAAVPFAAFALTPSQVFEQVKDSVVVVRALNAQGKPTSQGSGVMLPSAQVATNCHVVKNGVRFQVGRDKQFVAAELRASDGEKDLCLLVALGFSARPVVLGKAAALKVGEAVYAVGSPQGLELSLSNGIVSQLRGGPPPFIQTTAAISPGSSGGGLFDAEGRLVGITTFYLEGGQSLNFALPVEWLAEIKPGRERFTVERSRGEWMARAADLEQRKDWEGFLDLSRQWTRAEPGNSSAWLALGFAHSKLKGHNDAIEAFRQAILLESYNPSAWYSIGEAYSSLDRNIDAIDAYRQALRFKPDFVPAWSGLYEAYLKLNRADDAADALREIARLKPDQIEIWATLANVYNDLKRHIDAIDAARQALKIQPGHGGVWYQLGYAHTKLGRHSDAIDAYQQAIRFQPDHIEARAGLASAYALSGNKQAFNSANNDLRRYDNKRAELLDVLFEMLRPK